MSSLRALLASLIDYAGLFPPAELGMRSAVASYASARQGEFAWMLGRFIVPVSRLDEFEREAADLIPEKWGTQPWLVSALAGGDLKDDLDRIEEVNRRHQGRVLIDTIEIKGEDANSITRMVTMLPSGLVAYFEIPFTGPRSEIDALARTGARAKVRTGGLRPEMFPRAPDLARCIETCRQAGVPFKATAGLHHPIRSLHRLTTDPSSQSVVMHGFLNVFLAANFIHQGMSSDVAVQVLEEMASGAFQFDEGGITWRDRRLTTEHINEARQQFSISFGSCSFQEPIDDLKSLNLL